MNGIGESPSGESHCAWGEHGPGRRVVGPLEVLSTAIRSRTVNALVECENLDPSLVSARIVANVRESNLARIERKPANYPSIPFPDERPNCPMAGKDG